MCTFQIKWISILIIVTLSIKSSTLNVKQRVALLKKQIKEEIRAHSILPIEDNSSFEDNENNLHISITPVTSHTKMKRKTKKMTATTVKTPAKNVTMTAASVSPPFSQIQSKELKIVPKLAPEKKINETKSDLRQPIGGFYRRLIDENSMNTPVKWAHCQDIITPYLTGVKKDLTHLNHLTTNSPVVLRFIQLLKVNTTLYAKEDIYSILYQISNLQLRLFQWDVSALNMLFNILVKDKRHTFSNIKYGIKAHFEEWHLDISNLRNLLHQSRLFRPPCVRISDTTGSTKANKATKFPKKTLPTTTCESDEDFECKYRHK